MNSFGLDIAAAPPATAIVHSPDRSAWHARCNATSDDEHAASSVIAGPSSPNTYDSRPDITLPVLPVAAYPSAHCGTCGDPVT